MVQRPSAEAAPALPRTLLLFAQAYERTGERARARERLEELLAMWRGADPGLPLLREARALRARMDLTPVAPASR